MKNKSSMINRIVTLIGLTLGAFAISVFAQSTWTAAPGTPPTCPTGTQGCDAPLNRGLNSQSKLGQLLINTDTTNPYAIGLSVFGKAIFNGTVQIAGGSPGVGKVLTSSDNIGTASWQDPGSVSVAPSCRLIAGTATSPGWQTVPVPSECIDNTCSLALAVFHVTLGTVNTLKSTMITQFSDTFPFGASGPNWWTKPGSTNDGTTCAVGRNGTTDGCDQIVNYSDSIILYDDNTSGENDSLNWTLKDSSPNYRANLYVCR